MPLYDLVCYICGTELVNVKYTVAEISNGIPCPKCEATMEIVPGAVPTHFKGSGWAKDKYEKRGK
jgi:predicted nucleic acid-binding Zn ribbon protein